MANGTQPCWLVQGIPNHEAELQKIPGGWLIPYLDSEELSYWLPRAKTVIARSGYSSLMDFASLGLKQLVLIPTPGQPEQILLGNRLHEVGIALSVSQKSFQLEKVLKEVIAFRGFEKFKKIKSSVSKVVGEWLA